MSHTKEPWEAFCDVCESSTPHPDSEPIVRIGFDDYVRARACVNACAGFSTEDLELCPDGGLFHLASHALQLVDQRDELMKSLEHQCEVLNRNGYSTNKAQEAIARAKGGTA